MFRSLSRCRWGEVCHLDSGECDRRLWGRLGDREGRDVGEGFAPVKLEGLGPVELEAIGVDAAGAKLDATGAGRVDAPAGAAEPASCLVRSFRMRWTRPDPTNSCISSCSCMRPSASHRVPSCREVGVLRCHILFWPLKSVLDASSAVLECKGTLRKLRTKTCGQNCRHSSRRVTSWRC